MPRTPDEHVLAAEEGRISPLITIATVVLALLFGVALLYRFGLTVL